MHYLRELTPDWTAVENSDRDGIASSPFIVYSYDLGDQIEVSVYHNYRSDQWWFCAKCARLHVYSPHFEIPRKDRQWSDFNGLLNLLSVVLSYFASISNSTVFLSDLGCMLPFTYYVGDVIFIHDSTRGSVGFHIERI